MFLQYSQTARLSDYVALGRAGQHTMPSLSPKLLHWSKPGIVLDSSTLYMLDVNIERWNYPLDLEQLFLYSREGYEVIIEHNLTLWLET